MYLLQNRSKKFIENYKNFKPSWRFLQANALLKKKNQNAIYSVNEKKMRRITMMMMMMAKEEL